MSEAEWEALCDGCGLCCQIRVEDEAGELALSDAACRMLDLCSHRCKDYANRQRNVPDCVKITPDNVRDLHWLPHSCAYRLVAFGHDLPVLFDESLLEHERVWAAAGDPHSLFAVDPRELARCVEARVVALGDNGA